MTDWRIGASLALTGPEAVYGRQTLHALQLALGDEQLDPEVLVVEDDGSDAARAAKVARALADRADLIAVIGPMNSWTCESQAPVFAAAGVPHISPSASSPVLAERGWRTFFRMCPNDLAQAAVLADVAANISRAGAVAAVHDGTSFGEPLARAFLAGAVARGLRAHRNTGVSLRDGASFERAAAAVLAVAPDAILVVGLEEACRRAALSLRSAGVRGCFLGTDAVKPTRVLVTDGYEVEGPYLTNAGTDAAHQAPEFHRRFESRFGQHHSVYTAEAYDAFRLLARTARTSGFASRERVLEALHRAGPFTGLSGEVRFSATGERIGPRIGVYRYERGELVFSGAQGVKTPAMADAAAAGPDSDARPGP